MPVPSITIRLGAGAPGPAPEAERGAQPVGAVEVELLGAERLEQLAQALGVEVTRALGGECQDRGRGRPPVRGSCAIGASRPRPRRGGRRVELALGGPALGRQAALARGGRRPGRPARSWLLQADGDPLAQALAARARGCGPASARPGRPPRPAGPPGAAGARAGTRSASGEASTSKIASTREAVTFACWPPGPEERLVRSVDLARAGSLSRGWTRSPPLRRPRPRRASGRRRRRGRAAARTRSCSPSGTRPSRPT